MNLNKKNQVKSVNQTTATSITSKAYVLICYTSKKGKIRRGRKIKLSHADLAAAKDSPQHTVHKWVPGTGYKTYLKYKQFGVEWS